ncbi:methionine aminopeptidase 2B-like [Brassica napus]|uniref:methionine aminopeptidase 2B-like n=1 Tax=Brassica napus TaxID=3708 RepID=UPI00207AE37A|nr:methionine aminopeptidase 2B-like [Brassica napus]
MANENPEVVVAPVVENGGADSSSKGKEEQLESELSKKLEITEDANNENEEDVAAEEEEGSKGETSTKKTKKKKSKSK